jgi:hypothetical protein
MNPAPAEPGQWEEPPLFNSPNEPAIISNYTDAMKAFNDPRFIVHLTYADRTAAVQCPWLKFKSFFSTRKNLRIIRKAHDLFSLATQFSNYSRQTRSHKYVLKCISSHLDKINTSSLHSPVRFFSEIPDDVTVDWVGQLINPYLEQINAQLMDWPEGTPFDHVKDPEVASAFFDQNLKASPEQVHELQRFIKTFETILQSPRLMETDGIVRDMGTSSPLSKSENLANLLMLYIASKHSLSRFVSGCILLLVKEPGLIKQLQDNPDLIPSAINEFLRFITPQPIVLRVLTEDVTICGTTLPAGQRVRINLPHANRDPGIFTNPESVDLNRRNNPHLSFGNGPHFCIGQLYTKMVTRNFLSGFIEFSRSRSFQLIDSTPDQHNNALAPVALLIKTGRSV